MRHCLVSLISDQTIPNILLIKTLNDVDRHLFVATSRTREGGHLDWVKQFCDGVPVDALFVVEHDVDSITKELKAYFSGHQEYRYTVNITGGTKIMALVTYGFFQARSARIMYLPPGRNLALTISPGHRDSIGITFRLSAHEYLSAYGIQIEESSSLGLSRQLVSKLFQYLTSQKKRGSRLGGAVSDRCRVVLPHPPQELADLLEWPMERILSKEFYRYVSGCWFEEYVGHWISHSIPSAHPMIGVRIRRQDVSNELDVLFTIDNCLHVMELKTIRSLKDSHENLYKLDSISRDFGLYPKCYLLLSDPLIEKRSEGLPSLKARAKRLGVDVWTYSDVRPDRIEDTIKERI